MSYDVDRQNQIEQHMHDLSEAHRISQAMYDANPHANTTFDDQFNIVDCNPAALKFFTQRARSISFAILSAF